MHIALIESQISINLYLLPLKKKTALQNSFQNDPIKTPLSPTMPALLGSWSKFKSLEFIEKVFICSHWFQYPVRSVTSQSELLHKVYRFCIPDSDVNFSLSILPRCKKKLSRGVRVRYETWLRSFGKNTSLILWVKCCLKKLIFLDFNQILRKNTFDRLHL